VIILCVIEFLGLAGVLAWHGRHDEVEFLSKDFFGDYSVISCARSGDCFFSIILLEIARCILFILFYLVGRTKTLALLYIVCTVEAVFSIFEGVYGYVLEEKVFLDKTILLSWTLFISLAYLGSVFNIKYRLLQNIKENWEEKRSSKIKYTPRVPKGFRPDEEAPFHIQENSPLLKSLEHSVVLRSSTIIEDRLARSISKDEILSVNYDNNTTTFVDDATMYSAISHQKSLPLPLDNRQVTSPTSSTPKKVVPSIPRLVALMLSDVDGVPVKDIKYRFKMYKEVFTGADAVSWLVTKLEKHATTRQEAVALCQSLLDSGYIDDVYSNNPVVFEDSQTVFYRFSDSLFLKLPVHSLETRNSYAANIHEPTQYSNYSYYSSNYRPQPRQHQLSESLPSVESGTYRQPRNDNNQESDEETPKVVVREPEAPTVQTEQATEATPETPQEPSTESLVPKRHSSSSVEVPLAGEPADTDNADQGKPQMPQRISPALQRFVAEMRNPADGILLKDRRYYVSETQFIIFKKCFVASEAVDWLMNKRGIQEREHAVKILQKLMAAGVIQHVQDKPVFQDDPNFFLRFKEA